jgi:diguanylate cyclase (GGDEF)-like protein
MFGPWAEVWWGEEAVPPGGQPDVIVTEARFDRSDSGTIAVLGVGDVPDADIVLPADCSQRELHLVCRLLAEITRLRQDRDRLARLGEQFSQLAETDPLTGLANRRVWEHRLKDMLARLSSTSDPVWLAVVDLDRFKAVNDEIGMQRGDQVLVRAAQALAGAVRRDDLVARLGGDEFGLLLVGATAAHLPAVFDRLRAALREQAQVTASIGYVELAEGAAADARFAAAERAMRAAKRRGGDAAEAAPDAAIQ